MNKNTFTMTSVIKSTNVAVFAVALVFALATPALAQSTTVSSSASLVTTSSSVSNSSSSGSQTTTNTTNSGTNTSNTNSGGVISQLACAISPSATTVDFGGSVTFTWNANNYSSLTFNGASVSGGAGSYTVSNITSNTIFQIAGFDSNGNPCAAQIIITCNPIPVDCRMEVTKTVNKTTAAPGDELTYTITVKNVGTTNCTGSGPKIVDQLDPNIEYLRHSLTGDFRAGYDAGSVTYNVYEAGSRTLYFTGGDILTPGESGTITWVGRVKTPAQCGDFEIHNQAKATAKELNNFLTWVKSAVVKTTIDYDCPNPSVPNCDSFSASPSTVMVGNSATLTWQTTNATRVAINNGIGNVAADGSMTVTPLTTTTYVLSVFDGNNQIADNCNVTVTVSNDPVPVCKSFTVSPSSLGVGGGNVTLNWDVENASSVTITPTVGSVGLTGSRSVNVTQNTTFVLTATDTNGDQASCQAPVTVATQSVFTCPNNVDFTISDSSIRRGSSITLNWNVNGADSVSITGIGSVSSTGSQSFSPNDNTTYTLTATKGSATINCPVSVVVTSGGGGGGGGSSSPRCDLEISDDRITRGETVTLKWDTSRANDITIIDDRGRIIIETDEDEGEIEVTPTRDTEYTLIAERGSRDRECEVDVEVEEEGQVLGQVRDQQPLVAGISLSQVPYTGFEAGPVLTLMFYLLLMAWALYIAYFLVIRKEATAVPSSHFATVNDVPTGSTVAGADSMQKAQDIRPDAFAASVATTEAPTNLPTADKTVGYESYFAGATVSESQADQIVTELENRAHSQHALLSSDAIAFFMTTTEGSTKRYEMLDEVISNAKAEYPLEDGWVVLNQTRMESLCGNIKASTPAVHESLPTGSGSLAEAIVTGNIVAAYDMIGNRPMFALAEAAADLDSVVRVRKGDTSPISDLLLSETKGLSDTQLQNMITALTGAIDGTYTDEASAVKMAIMKAVKEIA